MAKAVQNQEPAVHDGKNRAGYKLWLEVWGSDDGLNLEQGVTYAGSCEVNASWQGKGFRAVQCKRFHCPIIDGCR